MITVNGREYPLWSQFVEQKEKWIGGILEDSGDSMGRAVGFETANTVIADIRLVPNGEDSAYFSVIGERFTCGFDVRYGGIGGGQEKGWLTFSGYGGHTWRIKTKEDAQ
jgi:hypothetical protein